MIKSLPRPQPCWKQERNIIKLLRKPVSSNCSPRELVIWRACVSCLGIGKKVWLRFIPSAHPRATDEEERLLKQAQFGPLSLPCPSDGCLGALRCSRLCRLQSPTQQPKLRNITWLKIHRHSFPNKSNWESLHYCLFLRSLADKKASSIFCGRLFSLWLRVIHLAKEQNSDSPRISLWDAALVRPAIFILPQSLYLSALHTPFTW